MHVVRSGEKRVLVIVKNVQKIRAKKNLGSATSSGTNGSDVVMVCVSLRGAHRGATLDCHKSGTRFGIKYHRERSTK